MLHSLTYGLALAVLLSAHSAAAQPRHLRALASLVLLRGDAKTAYRDPAVLYDHGTFSLYYTLVETEADGEAFSIRGL